MYVDLILISILVALVFESGFWDSLDEEINKRFKFHHLPHLLRCGYCQTWWLTLLYILITGNLSLFNICICLLIANLNEFWIALIGIVKGYIRMLLGWLSKYI